MQKINGTACSRGGEAPREEAAKKRRKERACSPRKTGGSRCGRGSVLGTASPEGRPSKKEEKGVRGERRQVVRRIVTVQGRDRARKERRRTAVLRRGARPAPTEREGSDKRETVSEREEKGASVALLHREGTAKIRYMHFQSERLACWR